MLKILCSVVFKLKSSVQLIQFQMEIQKFIRDAQVLALKDMGQLSPFSY